MTNQGFEQPILEGVRGLPPDALAEITDFIYFVRKRILHPEAFHAELDSVSIQAELRELSHKEEAHLEQELADYDRAHPRE